MAVFPSINPLSDPDSGHGDPLPTQDLRPADRTGPERPHGPRSPGPARGHGADEPSAIPESLAPNLHAVQGTIRRLAEKHGSPEPTLVAVTKAVSSGSAMALHRLGCNDLGENRAPEFLSKVADFASRGLAPRWHFIGHVQRNKARRILEEAHVLHSIDSVRLAETVARLLPELNRPVRLFLQVHLTGESEKHGLTPDELAPALAALQDTPLAQVQGLMVMGPRRDTKGKTTAEVFAEAQCLALQLQNDHHPKLEGGICRLSMGMSGDLDEAIRHGSTHVRVGSSLFQSPPPHRTSSQAAPNQ